MDKEYNLLGILKTLGKWKKHILIATVATMIVAAIVSMFLPNYYESYAVFYASNPELAQPEPLAGEEKSNKGIYGNDNDMDRLLAIANSGGLKAELIKKFNLADHYDVNTSTGKGIDKLNKKFDKHYKVTKTEYGAINLSVEDTDPKKAMAMVRGARERIDAIAKNLILGSQKNQIDSKKAFVEKHSKALEELNKKITSAKKKYNIYNTETQGEQLAELQSKINPELDGKIAQLNYVRSQNPSSTQIKSLKYQIATLKKRKATIDKSISLFTEGALELTQLEEEFTKMNEEVIIEKERLKKLESSDVNNYQATILVEPEFEPVVKSRPRRSLIVLGLGFLAFILSSMLAVFIENTRTVDWKSIYRGE